MNHSEIILSHMLPFIVSHFVSHSRSSFLSSASLSHLTPDYFVMHLPGIIVDRHLPIPTAFLSFISIVTLPIHHALPPPLPCQSVPVPRRGNVCYVRSIIQVLLLNSVVPHVNGRSWMIVLRMVVLRDVETDAVPPFLIR